LRILIVSFVVILLDQVSKILVKGFTIPVFNFHYEGMYLGQRIPVIGDFFRLTFIENPGMAFGFDPGSEAKLWISLFSLLASAGLLIYLYLIRKQSLSLRLAIAFILGGAVGNLIDRLLYGVFYGYAPLFYGKVVDFFDFDFFDVTVLGRHYERWPIFNVADAAVSIGVLILILFYKKSKEAPDEKPDSIIPEVGGNIPDNTESYGNVSSGEKDITRENYPDGENYKGKEIPD
jgi:signal peptidase II